jgi:RluA family pseudouridine synthase
VEPLPADAPHRVVRITDRAAGRRVDVFLSLRFSDWSRSLFARFIRSGHVRSDLRTLKPSSTLREGEVLRVYVPGIAPADNPPPLPTILYEDDWMLAIDKPPGMLVHPVGQRWAYALIGIVRRARPDAIVDLSHRLDRDTSGVVLLTKHPDANRHMKTIFAERKVGKTYWALVRGAPGWDETVCDDPLGHAAGSAVELRRGAAADGDSARTRFKVLRRLAGHALVGCKPLTGRTHQIRAHLECIGFPILGDKLYGQPDDVFLEILDAGTTPRVRAAIGFPRHALHARSIAFPHPRTGQILRIRAPLPADMRAIVGGAAPAWPLDAPVPADAALADVLE